MKAVVIIIFLFAAVQSQAQIMAADSAIQVIGYWNKKEVQTYNVETKKYKIKGQDTTNVEIIKHQIEMKVTDSTAKSYTIEWYFKNYDYTKAGQTTKSLIGVSKDLKVVVKTDEMGSFQEIVNWKDVRDEMKKVFSLAKQQLKGNRDAEKMFENMEQTLITKESIETVLLQDIQHFYTFHGGKYTLNEDVENTQTSNGVPGNPVNVMTTVQLAQLDVENDNGTVKYWKEFDTKQMTDATYAYLKSMMKSTGQKLPPREKFPDITYMEYIGSTIHGSSGWVIYSFFQKKASTEDGTMSVEERQIEIQ